MTAQPKGDIHLPPFPLIDRPICVLNDAANKRNSANGIEKWSNIEERSQDKSMSLLARRGHAGYLYNCLNWRETKI